MADGINDAFSFTFLQNLLSSESLSTPECKESLLKWNLDQDNLLLNRYRYIGSLASGMMDDYRRLLEVFLSSDSFRAMNKIYSSPSYPIAIQYDLLETNIISTSFFDKLEDCNIVTLSGNIRGCYEEVFHGISASDTLREVLLNEESENAGVFSPSDKKELIYRIFRILVIGGSMCQPETSIARYLEMTKAIYKEILTAYK
jgi:cilia- and flagella-associated protein 300